MLFAIGLLLFVGGFLMVRYTAPPFPFMERPRSFYVAAIANLIGLVLMLASVCMLAWRYLP